MSYRIGNGVDFHQLQKGRELWIGGVNIPFKKGAEGHSDADVLLHAICDALLGALALGDIGIHFPNTSNEFKNIKSTILLQRTMDLISKENYTVVNIDSTICLQEPKIKEYATAMRTSMYLIKDYDPHHFLKEEGKKNQDQSFDTLYQHPL